MGGMRKFLTAVLAGSFCILFSLVAAASGTTSVKLPQSAVTLTVGQKTTLKAAVSPSGYASLTVWATSNAAVAAVNASGVVEAEAPGTCTVSVEVKGVTAKCTVTVKSSAAVVSLDPAHVVTVMGRAPKLPSAVRAEMSDGTTKNVAVTWDPVDSSLYAVNGTFAVTGTASGVSYPAAAYVDVKTSAGAAYIVSVVPVTASTAVGTAPSLPSAVTIVLSDGSRRSYPVTWTAPAASKYAKAGVFTVNGSVYTSSVPAVAVVTVKAGTSGTIASLNAVTAATAVGVAPTLPSTVTAVLSDGTTQSVAVTWDTVSASSYASAGTFSVSGTVSGTSLKAVAVVTVTAATTAYVTGITPVTVTGIVGVAPTLPTTVTEVLSTGATQSAAVTWASMNTSQYATAGTFTVTGTVSGTSLTATATVTVKAATAVIAGVNTVTVTTTVGNYPPLPSTVTANLVDGTTQNFTALWNTVSASQYASAGTFVVSGTIAGTVIPTTAIVTVKASSAAIVSVNSVMLLTTVGTVPALPSTVTAVLSDGTTESVVVSWGTVSVSQYYSIGSFTVSGTVSGSTLTATAIVTVKASGVTVLSTVPVGVTTTVGKAPTLPSTVTAVLSDGTTQPVSVTWNAVTTTQYYSVGLFTVTGVLMGSGTTATATVTVTT